MHHQRYGTRHRSNGHAVDDRIGGSAALKKRLRRDSGDSSWKKRRIASWSVIADSRTEATVLSRSTSCGLSARSPGGSGGVASRMAACVVVVERVGQHEVGSFCRTISTGHGAVRTITRRRASISRCATAPPRRVPTMMRLMSLSRARNDNTQPSQLG